MKKRSIAFLLSLVMLLSLLTPTALAEEPDQEGQATEESTEIPALSKTTVAVPREAAFGDETTVTAPVGAESYQWQFQLMEDLWVNISGDESAAIVLTYAKVCNMLDESGAASLRCLVDGAASQTLTVTVTDGLPETQPAQEPGAPVVAAEPDEDPVADETPAEDETPVLDAEQGAEDTIVGGVIGVQADGNVKATYNIVINYVFAKDGSTASDPYIAQLAEGETFNTTVNFPTVKGYLPYVDNVQQDSYTFAIASVSEDTTVTVVYKPTTVDYKVIHYQQNVDNDEYTVIEEENKQGLTDSPVPKVDKEGKEDYEGFYSLLYERPNIAADGSTVIEVYYDRYYYLMTFDLDEGFGTEPIYARYGAKIGTVNEPTKAGYTFQYWTLNGTKANIPGTMPAENRTYQAVWAMEGQAKVTIVFWGENADDEGYSYLPDYTKVIDLKPDTEFTYSEKEMLICGKDVHTHGVDCVATCGKTEHTHSAVGGSCYTLTCTETSHTHGTGCYNGVGSAATSGSVAKPNNPKEGQVYKGYANTYIYIKGTWYYYTGSVSSGSVAPTTCGKVESNHTHSDSCYQLTCTTEEHKHDKSCYSCGLEEHTHNSSCYMQGAGLDSKLWKFVSSDTVTVAPDGSTVVNVYYDRVEYSVRFYEDQNCSDKREYTDLRITAKWGAKILDQWPEYENSRSWLVEGKNSTWQNSIQVMPVGGAKYWGPLEGRSNYTASYYVEALPGASNTVDYNGKKYVLHHDDQSASYGTVTQEDKYDIDGFKYVGGTSNGSSYGGAAFYYDRKIYKLTFNNQEKEVRSENIKYEMPLSSYADYVPTEIPSWFEPGSVEFEGWYQNPECTGEKVDLSNRKMPSNDLLLYAHWVPVQHTVKFYLTEKAADVYTPANAAAASFTVAHGSTLNETYVNANLTVDAMNEAKPNGDYKFVVWYYYKDGVKKYFDPSMQVREDMTLYGEWSSDTLKEYTVRFVLKDDPDTKVAPDLTGSGLAGTTKTFNAKGGTELFKDYQEGYFPTAQSQSLVLDIENDNLVITFEYVPAEEVPYTVKYINKETGTSVFDGVTVEDKYVSDNRKAVVTETFKVISGYMPDAYQKRLVVTVDGENILYFYYTKDDQHAYYKITHYTELSTAVDGTTNWTVYRTSEAPGDIGTRYTASPLTIRGYEYVRTEYVSNEKVIPESEITKDGAALPADGLEINLYYVRSEYPYQVRYLEKGTNNVLHEPKDAKGKYGEVISENAIEIPNYVALDPTSKTLDIQIEEDEEAKVNIITFYYELALTDLTITKSGCANIDEHQSFIFTVTGEGLPDEGLKVVVTGNGSVTIKGLKVGTTYTITEDTGWSWRYTPKTEEQKKTLDVDKSKNVVPFVNERKEDKWLNGCSIKVNNWKKKSGEESPETN